MKQQIKHAKDQLWHAKEVSVRTGEHEDVVRIKKELNTFFFFLRNEGIEYFI